MRQLRRIRASPTRTSHYNLGSLLQTVRGDIDGAEAAYRAAIAADPGHANAYHNLGFLLYSVRNEIDGAITALRAAAAADPGDAEAHEILDRMLHLKDQQRTE